MALTTLADLPADARRLLVELVAWRGDWETADLADEAGLDAADVSRRLLPWLRAQGLVEPAAYRIHGDRKRCSVGGLAGECFDALLKVGPMSRAQLCDAVTEARLQADSHATPVSPTSGSTKREIAALVAGGDIRGPGTPMATPLGLELVQADDEAMARCDAVDAMVARWRSRTRKAG